MFICLWFYRFLELVLIGFLVFLYSFYSVKFKCGRMLALPLLKILLSLIYHVALFMSVLRGFYRHLSIILIHFYQF